MALLLTWVVSVPPRYRRRFCLRSDWCFCLTFLLTKTNQKQFNLSRLGRFRWFRRFSRFPPHSHRWTSLDFFLFFSFLFGPIQVVPALRSLAASHGLKPAELMKVIFFKKALPHWTARQKNIPPGNETKTGGSYWLSMTSVSRGTILVPSLVEAILFPTKGTRKSLAIRDNRSFWRLRRTGKISSRWLWNVLF